MSAVEQENRIAIPYHVSGFEKRVISIALTIFERTPVLKWLLLSQTLTQ